MGRSFFSRACLSLLIYLLSTPATLANSFESAPYDRLNLSTQQAAMIADLDLQWKNRYLELQPTLAAQQRHLMWLLSHPNADPLEITATQQRIGQLKEQLSGYATTTYLKKRRVLNEYQRVELQDWLRRQFAVRTAHF